MIHSYALLNIFCAGHEEYEDDEKADRKPDHIPQEGEPDFIETNCHWEGCSVEFGTQDELVKVSQILIGFCQCFVLHIVYRQTLV